MQIHKCCECGADAVRVPSEALGQVRCAACFAHFHYKREERLHKCLLIALFAVFLLSLAAAAAHGSEEVPRPLLAGILAVETHSTLRADGSVEYRDQRIGAAGERGPSQIGRMVVRQWHLSPYRLQTDTRYAMAATARHLRWLHDQLGTWDLAAAWNGGIGGRNRPAARAYAARVAAAGGAL